MAYDFELASSQNLTAAFAPVTAMPITLSCWYKVKSTTGNHGLVAIRDNGGNSSFLLSVNGTTSPKRAVQAAAISSANTTHAVGVNTSAYTTNTWYHAAAVLVSRTNFVPYFNGGAGVTDANQGGAAPSNLNSIRIGTNAGSIIAEVGIWSAALTAAEIASLAKGMTCDKIRPQSLVFYAPLVRDLIDQKGGLAITNNNGATVANHPRIYP